MKKSLSNIFRFVLIGPSFLEVAVDLTCVIHVPRISDLQCIIRIHYKVNRDCSDEFRFVLIDSIFLAVAVAMSILSTCAKGIALLAHVPGMIISIINNAFWSMNKGHRGSSFNLACVAVRVRTTH